MHFLIHVVSSYAIAQISTFDKEQTQMFVVSNLIDIDHVFDGEISCKNQIGGTFKNNFFHKNWLATIAAGTLIHPYLGMGLAYHFYLDYLQPECLE